MSESKLQNKAIWLIIQIYLIVFVVSLVLSYFLVLSPLKRNAVDSYRTENEYILDEVDSVLNSVKEYSNYIAYSEDFMDKLNAHLKKPDDPVILYDLETNLYNAKNLKQGIQDVVLDVDGSELVTSILDLKEEEQELIESDWYQSIRERNYSGGFSRGITITQNNEELNLIAYSKSYHMKNRQFTLTIFFRYDDLLGNIMRYYHREFEKQYWVTMDGHALFEEEQQQVDTLLEDFGEGEKYTQSNRQGVLIRGNLGNSSWRSLAFVSTHSLFQKITETMLITLSMAVVLFIGTLIIVVYIVKRVTSPVHQLAAAMDQVITDNFATKLPVESDDEIGYLSRTFNSMSEKLQNYFQQLVEKMEAEQEMKFGLLISQIDPHFFCNTLNTIKYLAKQGRTSDVEVAASALSNILRDRLRIKNFQIYDTVEQETDTIRQYLTIQKFRYGDEVEILWDIDESVKDLKIPKNMIQPLVENALYHGLADEEDGVIRGTITIQIEKTNALYIRVRDDGRGMTKEQIQQLLEKGQKSAPALKGHGIGIDNIRERLEILYGDQAELRIHSEPGKWAEMEIVIWRSVKN